MSREELPTELLRVSRDRLRGYFDVLTENGIDTDNVPIIGGREDPAAIRAGLEEIFDAPSPPTAILVMSDRFAFVVLDWLAERGLSVPGDVSVVGYDGVPEGTLSRPPLTTIAQPIRQIGQLAVEMITDSEGEPRRAILEAHLLVRGSAAPPPRS